MLCWDFLCKSVSKRECLCWRSLDKDIVGQFHCEDTVSHPNTDGGLEKEVRCFRTMANKDLASNIYSSKRPILPSSAPSISKKEHHQDPLTQFSKLRSPSSSFSTMTALLRSHPIPFSISDLSRYDIDLLTQILSQTPNDNSQLRGVSNLIRALPHHLRAPIPFQARVADLLPRSARAPACPPLCSLHRTLNAQLIHAIFTAIVVEVGIRLNRLAASTRLDREQERLVQGLRELQALWLIPGIYRTTFRANPSPRWRYQDDACEACILSIIGNSTSTITALRTVILSRLQRHRPKPRLLRWVDGWIGWTGRAESLRVTSEDDAAALRRIRETTRRAEGRGRGRERNGLAPDAAAEDDDDFENDIIEYYAGLPSSIYSPIGGYDGRSSGPSSSTYLPTGRGDTPFSDPTRDYDRRIYTSLAADQRADDYQALLGSRTWSEASGRGRQSAMTTWSAFLQ